MEYECRHSETHCAIAEGSQADLESLAQSVVDSERKVGHTKLADQLAAILARPRQNKPPSNDSRRTLADLPTSRRHGESLVTIVPREMLEHHMVLPKEIEARFARIEKEYAARERLGAYGLRPRKTILLYGPPGCGKSLGAKRLAWNVGLPLLKVRFDALTSSFFGESASNLRSVFESARSVLAFYCWTSAILSQGAEPLPRTSAKPRGSSIHC